MEASAEQQSDQDSENELQEEDSEAEVDAYERGLEYLQAKVAPQPDRECLKALIVKGQKICEAFAATTHVVPGPHLLSHAQCTFKQMKNEQSHKH